VLELTHVYVLFRNSHLANDFNFNVNGPVRVEVEVYVDFATSLLYGVLLILNRWDLKYEALNHMMIWHIRSAEKIDCPSMVVFLNMFLLKYYHAHNIHHYLLSHIGLGFCYSTLKGKFLFIFNIFGGKHLKSVNSLVHTTVLY